MNEGAYQQGSDNVVGLLNIALNKKNTFLFGKTTELFLDLL